jgi:hypothetical protein
MQVRRSFFATCRRNRDLYGRRDDEHGFSEVSRRSAAKCVYTQRGKRWHIWSAVTCHLFFSRRSCFPCVTPKESGFATDQSGDKSPHSKCLSHCRAKYNHRVAQYSDPDGGA